MKQVLAACLAAIALSAGGEIFETDDQFSITLPDGWVEIPYTELANYSDRLVENAEDPAVGVYDYGYQMDASAGWLSYPCILVQVKNVGRFSTGELERFVERSAGSDADLAADKTLFLEVREQGGIKVLVGRQLTEYGYIELTGYAPADTFDEYENVFETVFTALAIDEPMTYKPRLTDNAPVVGDIDLGKVFVVCIQAALVGFGLWLIYGLVKRTLKRAPKSA